LWIVFLATYAITATAALIYLAIRLRGAGASSNLESLPDLPPVREMNYRTVRSRANLPAGHVLPLGGRQQFGEMVVEPLRVTRGPLQFEHYTGDAARVRPATAPVLKLWLRFTNASPDQRIAPLDARLLSLRRRQENDNLVANNFVCRQADRELEQALVLTFDLALQGEWKFRGQDLDRPLAPGESVELYLPTTEEGVADLEGDLVWRFQMRKGFGPRGFGVTTLVDVEFPSAAIIGEDGVASDALTVEQGEFRRLSRVQANGSGTPARSRSSVDLTSR
jgi:hypothetical protein